MQKVISAFFLFNYLISGRIVSVAAVEVVVADNVAASMEDEDEVTGEDFEVDGVSEEEEEEEEEEISPGLGAEEEAPAAPEAWAAADFSNVFFKSNNSWSLSFKLCEKEQN